jgi:hypothetical protein
MGQGRFRLLFAMALGALALVCAGTAGAAQSCASRIMADWKDGRIDQTYAVSCYRTALADLPEDVRVYSSAQTDITRALQARVGARASKSAAPTSGGGGGVSPLLVVLVTGAILVGAGSVAAAVR